MQKEQMHGAVGKIVELQVTPLVANLDSPPPSIVKQPPPPTRALPGPSVGCVTDTCPLAMVALCPILIHVGYVILQSWPVLSTVLMFTADEGH